MTDMRTKLLNEYIEKQRLEKRPCAGKQSTLEIYFRYLDEENIDFLRIRIPEAQGFQTALTLKTREDGRPYYGTATVIAMVTRVASFYDYLKTGRRIPFNPFREIIRLRGERSLPRAILSEEEMAEALRVLRNFMEGKTSAEKRRLYKAHLIAELMYATGARIHEIAGLTVSDVDVIRGVVTVHDRKTGTPRTGMLNEYTARILSIYIEKTREYVLTERSDDTWLFGTHNHIRRWINDMMNRAIEMASSEKRNETVNFTSHCFRHSMASHLLKHGCDIRYIQEILGHESIGSTQIYTRVVKEDLRGIIDTYHPRSLRKADGTVV